MSRIEPNLNQGFCKSHPNQQSNYFIVEQPWVRYCQICALNVALSGRKIEKELTQKEFDQKMLISTLSSQFRRNLTLMQETTDHYECLKKLVNEVSKPLHEKIQALQNVVNELVRKKQELVGLYNSKITEQINQYFDNQGKILSFSMEMKKQIQFIETNFLFLISMDADILKQHTVKWNEMLGKSRQKMLVGEKYLEAKNQLVEIVGRMVDKLQRFQLSKIDLNMSAMAMPNTISIPRTSQMNTIRANQDTSKYERYSIETALIGESHQILSSIPVNREDHCNFNKKAQLKLRSSQKEKSEERQLHTDRVNKKSKRASVYDICNNSSISLIKR